MIKLTDTQQKIYDSISSNTFKYDFSTLEEIKKSYPTIFKDLTKIYIIIFEFDTEQFTEIGNIVQNPPTGTYPELKGYLIDHYLISAEK